MSELKWTISEPANEIFAALAKAQAEISPASKDAVNPHFKSRYADLASVWDACRGPLTKNGICVIQIPSTEGNNVTLHTIMGHTSGQKIVCELSAVARAADPQAIGSVLTYLRRYSLSAVTSVAPDDDDDGETGTRGPDRSHSAGHHDDAPPPANRGNDMPDDRRAVPPTKPAANNYPPCPNCGGPMKVKKKKDGTPFLGCPAKKADGSWCNGAIWQMPSTGEESQVEPEPGNQQQPKSTKGCERFETQLRGILNDIGCKNANEAQSVIEFIAPGITLAAAKANEQDCGKVVDAIEAACTFQNMSYAQIYADAMAPSGATA